MMKRSSLIHWLVGFLFALMIFSPFDYVRSEVVFDNTQIDESTFWPQLNEYGDEVELAGSARVITSFQMEYYGDFFPPTGAEKVRVRLYHKDGPPVVFPDTTIPTPGTLLYESEKMPIYPGYNNLSLNQMSVPVSNVVIWTVQFEGFTGLYPGMGYSNRAGLTFYHPPVVGASYDDFWMKTDTGWMVYNFPINLKANFGIRMEANPEPPLEIVSHHELANGGRQLVLAGPSFRTAMLQYSTDETHWTTLRLVTFLGQPIDYIDAWAPKGEPRYYRLAMATQDVISLVPGRTNQYGEYELKILGVPGRRFFLEGSADFRNWSLIKTNDFRSVVYQYADWRLADYPQMKIYRGGFLPDAPTFIGNFGPTTNGHYLMYLFGPPGRQCVIEVSEDAQQWRPLGTNTFSYIGGVMSYVDFSSAGMRSRYYRARLRQPQP